MKITNCTENVEERKRKRRLQSGDFTCYYWVPLYQIKLLGRRRANGNRTRGQAEKLQVVLKKERKVCMMTHEFWEFGQLSSWD